MSSYYASDDPLASPLSSLNIKTEIKQVIDINPALGDGIQPEILKDGDAINAMVANMLEVSPGQRWWYPNYASPLKKYLFELVDTNIASSMKFELRNAFRLWMPFLQAQISVIPVTDEGYYNIQISWSVNGADLADTFVADFYPK